MINDADKALIAFIALALVVGALVTIFVEVQ